VSDRRAKAVEIRGAEVSWRQPLPRERVIDREEDLLSLSRGKRVIHIGFVDERLLETRLAMGDWLHGQLAAEAASIVGIDISEAGVAWARQAGYEAYVADAQSLDDVRGLAIAPAEVVVAGEVIEHVAAPGPFLRALRELTKPDGVLVITTPNAFRIINFFAPVAGIEVVHPDHRAWHSPYTLRALLEDNGWDIDWIRYYQNASDVAHLRDGLARWAAISAANSLRRLARGVGLWFPYWSDGLIALARPSRFEER
jgi:SAM-dependent methyltransferase